MQLGKKRLLLLLIPSDKSDSVYLSPTSILAWYVLAVFAFPALLAISARALTSEWRALDLYETVLSLAAVVFIFFFRNRQLLVSSRWRPRLSDLAVGVSCGLLVKALLLACVAHVATFLSPPYLEEHSFVPAVLLGPVLEETVFRGLFLKSFKARFDASTSVLLVALLASVVHPQFWFALPAQITFSVLYVVMGDSLAASVTAHAASNALVYLPVAQFFERWHVWNLFRP